jgi:hypothetical protein
MRLMALFYLFYCFSLKADSWQNKLYELLPVPIKQIRVQKTTFAEVERLLGKPALQRDDKFYWVYQGFEYALELVIKDDKVVSLHFSFPKLGPSIEDLKLDPNRFKPHPESNRFIDFHDVGGAITIDLSSQTVHSLRIR